MQKCLSQNANIGVSMSDLDQNTKSGFYPLQRTASLLFLHGHSELSCTLNMFYICYRNILYKIQPEWSHISARKLTTKVYQGPIVYQ
jgi:hypothetical protein